ncbi:hypothetical protein OJF2_63120 [Aquisphaera giovannonii]|uniref:Uncharacterized protein n=1 Tax=Aquisphaera giovannonii TaxID=406548 RepID=A0A5B9WCQ4_9BACT|nr:hypothetical protein [Aquisphaera giovannonii]QEH37721.1 hypothetical protein OJF2_63120 [Aquisphaera giovannonii]
MPVTTFREAFVAPRILRARRRSAGLRLRIEELETRIVPSLTRTTLGEGSVKDNVVTMGVAHRAETNQQPTVLNGAYATLPASEHCEIAFKFDLSTGDSYNANDAGGGGYWDSSSVSVTARPYPQRHDRQPGARRQRLQLTPAAGVGEPRDAIEPRACGRTTGMPSGGERACDQLFRRWVG